MKIAEQRVRLVKTLDPKALPVGTLGTLIDAPIRQGLNIVVWDTGDAIPMFSKEIEVITIHDKEAR